VDAIENAIRENERYVHWLCRRYEGREDYEDILQEARLAILSAFKRHDPARGTWSAFAAVVVEHAIGRYFKAQNWKSRRCPGVLLSLDEPLNADDDTSETLGDTLTDSRIDVAREVTDAVEIETILSVVQHPRSRIALELRIDGLTLEETGAALGVSGERARQLEMKALQAIRRARVA
jgi:RNA polymerase sigma factor (sigma-70 family)